MYSNKIVIILLLYYFSSEIDGNVYIIERENFQPFFDGDSMENSTLNVAFCDEFKMIKPTHCWFRSIDLENSKYSECNITLQTYKGAIISPVKIVGFGRDRAILAWIEDNRYTRNRQDDFFTFYVLKMRDGSKCNISENFVPFRTYSPRQLSILRRRTILTFENFFKIYIPEALLKHYTFNEKGEGSRVADAYQVTSSIGYSSRECTTLHPLKEHSDSNGYLVLSTCGEQYAAVSLLTPDGNAFGLYPFNIKSASTANDLIGYCNEALYCEQRSQNGSLKSFFEMSFPKAALELVSVFNLIKGGFLIVSNEKRSANYHLLTVDENGITSDKTVEVRGLNCEPDQLASYMYTRNKTEQSNYCIALLCPTIKARSFYECYNVKNNSLRILNA